MNTLQTEQLTDTEIIDRVLVGEKALYELLVRRFNPYLYKIGRSYNYSHEDTQDLMQDTFVDAYRNLDGFQGRSGFKTWISRIMLNNCYRKKEKFSFKYEIMKDINERAIPAFHSSDNDTGKLVQNRELGRAIENALLSIPEDYRMVFTLREVNSMSVAETAILLGISESNVKVRLNRAKALLRVNLEKSYPADELFEFHAVYCDAMVDRVMKIINEI